MFNKYPKPNLVLFFVFAFLIFSRGYLKAEMTSKSSAVDMALAEMEQEDAVTSASKEAVPAYRQRLKEAVTTAKEEHAWELDSYLRYMPSQDLKDQPGKVEVIEGASELSYNFKAFGRLPIELSINEDYFGINDKEGVPVPLPNSLTQVGFGLQATVPMPFVKIEKLYLRAKVQPSFYSDNWNTSSDAFKLPSFVYGIYQPSEKWTFVLGVAAYPGFEHVFAPIAGLIYKPNDRLSFNLVPSTPNISYQLTKHIGLFVEGSLSYGEYQIHKDNLQGKRLAYNEVHGGAGIEIKINDNIRAYGTAGYMFNRYLKYRDSLGKVDIKNGMYSEFRLEMGI